jgi:hypothetical protein
MWTGSLPNLTVELTIQPQSKEIQKKKNDTYATFADNLNQIDMKETISSISKKVNQQFFILVINGMSLVSVVMFSQFLLDGSSYRIKSDTHEISFTRFAVFYVGY